MSIEKLLKNIRVKVYKEDLSESTKRNYLMRMKLFIMHFNTTDPTLLSATKVNNYLDKVLDTNISSSTKRAHYRSIILLYKFLDHPIKIKSRSLPDPKNDELPDIYTKKQIIAYSKKINDKKQQLIFLLLYSTGIRLNNVVNIKIKDLNFKKNTITLVANKKSFDHIFPVSLKEKIIKYAKNKDKDEYLFLSSRNDQYSSHTLNHHFRKAQEDHQLKYHITVLSLKASAIVHLIKDGYSEGFIENKFGLTHSPILQKISKKYSKHDNVDLL